MSSDESDTELTGDEIVRNFDDEAKLITDNLLPEKSKARYVFAYDQFISWQKKNNSESFSESVFLVYFKELSKNHKPPTLWGQWSMLRTTINLRHAIDINSYHNLKSFIKNLAKGYQPKKAQVLTLSQINNFLNNFDDLIYLAKKVILIFGVFGAMRSSEFCQMNVQDIEDTGNQFIVTIKDNKNYYPRNFIIGKEYYAIVRKYIDLRPKDIDTRRFFINYQKGKCTCQVIGKNKISEVPKVVAICLQLENPETYTGHCLRRSAATILANSGANITALKQLGGWRSSTTAEGYVENSLANRQKLYQKLISSVHNAPSTSTAIQTPLPQLEESRPGETHEKMSPDLLDNDSFIIIKSNENPEVNENSSLLQSTKHNNFDSTAAANPKNIPSAKSSPQIKEHNRHYLQEIQNFSSNKKPKTGRLKPQISNKNSNAAEIENDDVNDITVYSSFVTMENNTIKKVIINKNYYCNCNDKKND
ncbi:uncharacterized protein LOC130676889 [Microplitis mediator]|uniref:uncharacterized protein LOC130669553 n=1 Tax=Microplitis mediator TaxID=375433 RepID=UPI002557BBD5|nr:uncharacterized protein LOC130669553 [Microplitis mediator]XP_057339381.1 uncharacterized protein LOC130676889 [Microplitis mediator]